MTSFEMREYTKDNNRIKNNKPHTDEALSIISIHDKLSQNAEFKMLHNYNVEQMSET